MRSFKLTPAEISELHLAHKAAKKLSNTKNAYKINAVLLLGTGWTLEEVSNALLLDEETVRTYSHLYREDGIDTLLKTNHRGRSCKLTEAQQEILNQELQGKIYTTARSVSQFIEKEFSQHYSDSGVTDLLHRLDFVYKKPKLIPNVPDEAVQEQFIKDYYEFMLNKPEDVAVFFMDATHPEHNATAAHGWIKKALTNALKGKQKAKESTSMALSISKL